MGAGTVAGDGVGIFVEFVEDEATGFGLIGPKVVAQIAGPRARRQASRRARRAPVDRQLSRRDGLACPLPS